MPALTRRQQHWLLRSAWLAGIIACGIVWPAFEYRTFDIEPGEGPKAFLQLALLHGSWLLWPLLAQSLAKTARRLHEGRHLRASGALALVIVSGLVCYARFVEPAELTVRHTVVPAPVDIDIAVVSDIHIGIYTRPAKLRQVVSRLNRLHVNLVLFAGDLTYDPPKNLAAALAPLDHLDRPMYAVLGNHDVELPGPPLAGKIRRALAAAPVHFIEHRVVDFPAFRLAGLYDWWSGRDDAAFLRELPHGKPLLVLMHQPHSLQALHGIRFALAIAGHTHGGQVHIPWLTDWVFRYTRGERYIDGLYRTPEGLLFVTPGVGVTGLPLRFDCPPVIDVLELRRAGH